MASRTFTLFITLSVTLTILFYFVDGTQWPVPYKRFASRPKANPYCKAGVISFCPTGREANTMPTFADTDVVEVYALKAPVWEFKFGDLLAKFNVFHDAIGFRNVNTGKNYTMEWYELFQLFNCTFPHLLPNTTLKWCNQGAACIYDGIDDIHWSQNGTLVKVATIPGKMFNDFGKWVEWDNNTGIYYETWTVENEPGGQMWFDSFDCASWVLRAFKQIASLGGKFNQSVKLNYTRIHLYSKGPLFLGDAHTVFGPGSNKTRANDILKFYQNFQSHQNVEHILESLMNIYLDIKFLHKFYFFYNFEYWYLPLVDPYIRLSYNEVPLPGSGDYLK